MLLQYSRLPVSVAGPWYGGHWGGGGLRSASGYLLKIKSVRFSDSVEVE